jgi:hypothetical protein
MKELEHKIFPNVHDTIYWATHTMCKNMDQKNLLETLQWTKNYTIETS